MSRVIDNPNYQGPSTCQLEYLDLLRESGITNMFGAGSYLEQEFGLSRQEARAVLKHWMQTFSDQHKGEL